ncbi:hypothetical protein BDB00DRAFT_813514 [Zychaea mexicana]|uniref:uncharacterized protein n=1 Tax=Zychaea mexicana TaxID=64656 RepID=UPI0022FE48B3|nr:uncharacterized protein BDB00DRAFT_813514 [Zychaea mexicana]KAI9495485.1 hypothetical protein BDB00DRAFT_813514 [Zychaea mexicana]
MSLEGWHQDELTTTTTTTTSHQPFPQLYLQITTVDYNRTDPVFWIQALTTLVKYRHKQRRIPRYYSELEKLYGHLTATLDDVYIPVLPICPRAKYDKQKRMLSRHWWVELVSGNENNNNYDDDEDDDHDHDGRRQNGLPNPDIKIQHWLDRIASHERIQQSEGLREFVESDVGFRPQLNKKKTSKSKRRHSATIRNEDLEPEFWLLSEQIDAFRLYLGHLQPCLSRVAREQKGSAQAWMELASMWITYGGMERHPELFVIYKYIVKACQQVHSIELLQEISLNETLGEEVDYQIKNAMNAQGIMTRRLSALSDYFASRKRTESSLRNVERLKSSSNIDRDQANDAIAELEYARLVEHDALQRYERVDSHYDEDLEKRYKPQTANDMITSIRDYAKSQLILERQKLAAWQSMLTRIKHPSS